MQSTRSLNFARRSVQWLAFSLTLAGLSGCADVDSSPLSAQYTSLSHRSLYVVSGGCYGGGVTTSTGSATIAAYDASTGAFERLVIDYNNLSPGDMPVAIADYDSTHILVLVENTAGRRIDLVTKQGGIAITYLVNSTAFGTAGNILRTMIRSTDGSLLISKSVAIEKFTPSRVRALIGGATPWVSNPTATACASTATLITSIIAASNGKLFYSHAAATPANKIAMISATGYATTADCLTSQAAPTTTAMPTDMIIHSSGKLIAAFGSTTYASNLLMAYDINTTANTISNPVTAFGDGTILSGPSAIVENTSTSQVYVANASSNYNTVELMNFNSTTKLLTVATTTSFIPPSIYTRCVSDLKVIAE